MHPAKRSFVFPAAITFALFAFLLLFGTRRPAALARVAAPVAPPAAPAPAAVTLTDPVEAENHDSSPAASQPVPMIAEPPPLAATSGLTIPVRPETVRAGLPDVTRLPSDWGFKPGLGDGLGTGLITATGLDSVPRAVSQSIPAYPYAAKVAGRTGQVTVEFWVDGRGAVHDPRAVSSTATEFEAAALRAVAKWRFEPGRQNGRIVSFRMAVPVKFSIEQ